MLRREAGQKQKGKETQKTSTTRVYIGARLAPTRIGDDTWEVPSSTGQETRKVFLMEPLNCSCAYVTAVSCVHRMAARKVSMASASQPRAPRPPAANPAPAEPPRDAEATAGQNSSTSAFLRAFPPPPDGLSSTRRAESDFLDDEERAGVMIGVPDPLAAQDSYVSRSRDDKTFLVPPGVWGCTQPRLLPRSCTTHAVLARHRFPGTWYARRGA